MTALRVEIPPRGRLLKTCYVMPEQLRALDRRRFGEGPLAHLDDEEMTAVERLFAAVAGLSRLLIPTH